MATEELKEFVEDRLVAYDPDIDLTDGSPAQDQVVDPIVRRFEPDPFELDVESFITARLNQEYPNYNIREGSGLRDLLVKPNQILMDPISREVQLLKQGQSLSNPELLAPTEADALVANIFVTRSSGGLSTGTVRLYFNGPVAINISVGNVSYTASGLRYIPTTLQSISAEAMIFNQSGNLYYFDVQVTAEAAGSNYNTEKDTIIGITNLNAAVRVTNPERFEGGLDEESTDDLVERAETSITERSLVVARGVSARLRDQFEDLVHLQIVGFTDEEMERDVISGGDLGPILLSSNDGYTEDDGNGDAYTSSFKTRYGDFVSLFGSLGGVVNHKLVVNECSYDTDGEVKNAALDRFYSTKISFTSDDVGSMLICFGTVSPTNTRAAKIIQFYSAGEVKLDSVGVAETNVSWILLRPPEEYDILSVVGSTELIVDGALPVDKKALAWSIRQKSITLSNIPGGIIFSEDQAAIEIQSDEVHIGGATDFYVRGTGVESKELVISSVSDQDPILAALTGSTSVATPAEEGFFRDTTKDFVQAGVQIGYSLIVETGVDAGTKRILRAGKAPTGADDVSYLQVDPLFTSTDADLRYKIVDDIDVNLTTPKTVRGSGLDLQTVQLSDILTTTSAVDFLALGTEVGDVVEILEGNDKNPYSIKEITGTGNKNLVVNGVMKSTSNNLSYQVYGSQDGVEFPLVRVSGVGILDSSNQPTGDIVPFAEPVDARATAFSNAGRGTKLSTSDAITGIIGTADLDGLTYPLAATVLDMKVNNGGTQNITLTGATSKTDLLNKINAVIFNIAGTITIDSEARLTIRSGDRWLQVLAKADNANVGLDINGEDNRQIQSAGNILDWSSPAYDIKTRADVVSITTGDNLGFFYIVAVEGGANTRLLVVGFDEESRTTRFLSPNVGVALTAGSRSYGKARVYFLDPTSFEVRGNWHPALLNTTDWPANAAIEASGGTVEADELPLSYFTADVNGAELRFVPDPALNHQLLPPPDDTVPNNLYTEDGNAVIETMSSPATGDLGKNSRDIDLDFLSREVHVGDLLEVTYFPLQCTVDVRPVAEGGAITYPTDLQGKTLILSIDGTVPRVHTFSDQIANPDDLVDEINEFFGIDIAFIEEITPVKHVRLEEDVTFTLHRDGTANTVLGFPTGSNTSNSAPADIDGFYTITEVGDPSDVTRHDRLGVTPTPSHTNPNEQAQHFRIVRPGVQRMHSTLMNDQLENGLYYMDVELLSEGSGDQWNVEANQLFVVTGHTSDGYRLIVLDPNLTYSTEEDLNLEITRRILTVGSSDRPDLATQISSQNLQVNYDRSPLASSIQSFSSSDLERVLNASILVRHLQPHYINFEMFYRGGSSADVVRDDINAHLDALAPDDRVESSDIQDLARRRGSDYIENPIELVAVAYDKERHISVDRSTNYVTKGRLATFFGDNITVTRETAEPF